MDVWSIGVCAWEVLHGGSWAKLADQSVVPTYKKYFGAAALTELFGHLPRFKVEAHRDGAGSQKCAELWDATFARASRQACQALALPFALDHAQRPSCAAILAQPWLQDRPVFRRHTVQGHYGPTVFLQTSLDDESLELLRGDKFFTAEYQAALELGWDMDAVREKENKARMCTEAVPPHGVVKLTIAGNLGQGTQAATINKLSNGCELPCEWARVLANACWFSSSWMVALGALKRNAIMSLMLLWR